MMGQYCWGWGPGYLFGAPWNMVVGLVFWALVLYGIFLLISRLLRFQSQDVSKNETPMEILKKRYAQSEIDAQEFERRKKDLQS